MGPVLRKLPAAPSPSGYWPLLGMRPALHLWPNTPLKNAGMRMDPPTSEPSPKRLAPEPTMAPSPPELPPTMRLGS
jgi:hypothetical protein